MFQRDQVLRLEWACELSWPIRSAAAGPSGCGKVQTFTTSPASFPTEPESIQTEPLPKGKGEEKITKQGAEETAS